MSENSPTSDPGVSLPPTGGSTARLPGNRELTPWMISLGLHVVLIIIGMLVTWSVSREQDLEVPVHIVADFHAMTYDPVDPSVHQMEDVEQRPIEELIELPAVEDVLTDRLDDLQADPLREAMDRLAQPAPALSVPTTPGSARFMGLSTTNARDVVYAIDASGSMITSFPVVLRELSRSLERLSEQQRFTVIFFQEGRSIVVPPASRLIEATPDERSRVIRWVQQHVIPAGGTNPLVAIEKAMSFSPDVIFLLSQDITGYGRYEIDQRDLLTRLDRLNPTDDRNGLRHTRICCIQFLDQDPLATMQRIAEAHGGLDGYTFIDRAGLGMEEP